MPELCTWWLDRPAQRFREHTACFREPVFAAIMAPVTFASFDMRTPLDPLRRRLSCAES
jgi:hypothetical protein